MRSALPSRRTSRLGGSATRWSGRPFTRNDVEAICSIGRSRKDPRKHIGYLGVGFKAVFLVSSKPHIYSKPYWWIEQGSDISTAIARTPFGDITFWLEFQPSRYAHMLGMFTERRVSIRPDIVVAKGCFEQTEEFINSKRRIDLIIECKEDPFNAWKNKIESQILPYQETFKPNNFIIASLEHVPDNEKRYLERRGIRVIDNLKVNSRNIITFYNIVREQFKIS